MVLKRANIGVFMTSLMKSLLLMAIINTNSASAHCAEEKTEKPVADLPTWKNEEATAIAEMAKDICKKSGEPCGHACPSKKGTCVEEMVAGAPIFGSKKCTLLCSCHHDGGSDASVKHAWSLWLDAKKEMANKNEKENPCDVIMPAGQHADRCKGDCPSGCEHECKAFSFRIPYLKTNELCFCIPPKENKQYIPLPLSSAHAIDGFCGKKPKGCKN